MSLSEQRRVALIRALARHRAMTVKQLAEYIEAPKDAVGHLLTGLRKDKVCGSSPLDRAGTLAWYLTKEGARDAYLNGLIDQVPVTQIPSSIVGGMFTTHHRTVNGVGLKIRELARARGDYATWDNEVRHPLKAPIVIADMVLKYELHDYHPPLCWMFVEVDRGAAYRYPPINLIEKLLDYERLMKDRDLWRYPEFPDVLVVMDGASTSYLSKRIRTVSDALRDDYHARVPVKFVLLENLLAWGPHEMVAMFNDSREEELVS